MRGVGMDCTANCSVLLQQSRARKKAAKWRDGPNADSGATTKGKTAAKRSLRNSISDFDQAASDVAFRFLRQPSRPKPPRPEAKRGSAAGSGVAEAVTTSATTYDVLLPWSVIKTFGTEKVMESNGVVEMKPKN